MNDPEILEGDLTSDEFKTLGYRAIDEIADYLGSVRDVPVFAGRKPGEAEPAFDEPLPKDGQAHPVPKSLKRTSCLYQSETCRFL
jgi:hypothetical protein